MTTTGKIEALCGRISEHAKCVSKVRDVDFRKSLLDWQCSRGHTFSSTAHSVQGRMLFHARAGAVLSNESICPICIKQRVSREIHAKATQYLDECRHWGPRLGINCVSQTSPKPASQVQWQCEFGHEWTMTLDMAKSWGRGHVCPECNGMGPLSNELQSVQKAVAGSVAHQLREEGFNLTTIADAMGKRSYELAYCFERYSPDLVHHDIPDSDTEKYANYVHAVHTRIHRHLKEMGPTLTQDEVIKCAACLAAQELMRANTTMKEIKESFGDRYKQIDYWLSTTFPRYKNIPELITDERIVSHMNELLEKSRHLMINIDDPLCDLEKLKRSDQFRVAVICLLKKHEATGLVTKADILRRFKVTYKTLEMWGKRINHGLKVGQIVLNEEIERIQAVIESEFIGNAA